MSKNGPNADNSVQVLNQVNCIHIPMHFRHVDTGWEAFDTDRGESTGYIGYV